MELEVWSRYIYTKSKKVPDINSINIKYLPPKGSFQELEEVTITSNVKKAKQQ